MSFRLKHFFAACLCGWLVGIGILEASPRRPELPAGTLLGTPGMQLGPIYYAADANKQEIDAANDLAAVLGRITGTEWPVQAEPERVMPAGIFVGNTIAAAAEIALVPAPSRLPDDAAVARVEMSQTFRVKVSSHRVTLDGATPEATVLAVYWFLQNAVGVHWFIPGELGEELPASPRIRLTRMDRTITPSFYNRTLLGASQMPGGEVWARRNLLTRRWNFNHALHNIVTSDLFESKPHWFSRVKGKLAPTSGGRGLNPNLAEPELARFVAKEAVTFFKKNPDQTTFSISITDNINFDESPETLEIVTPFRFFRNRPDYSDLIFGFANRVAGDIWPWAEDGSLDLEDTPLEAQDKYLGSLAYYWAENVPSFPVHPRVIPYLTSDRAQWYSEDYREQDKALIKAWCEAGPEIVGTWDYYEGGPYFVPRCFTGIVAESIPFLHDAGVRAFFAEGRPHWGFDAPRFWLAAQLLSDAKQDPDTLLNEFYRGYFGEAAGPMSSFYEQCERQWMAQEGPVRWLKYYRMPSQAELFPMPVWEELGDLLAEAEALAESPRVQERLALVRENYDYSRAACSLYFAWKEKMLSGLGDKALERAREAFAALPEIAEIRKDGMQAILLEATEAPPAPAPGNADTLFREDFEKPLFDGDDQPSEALFFRGGSFRDGWRTTSFHNDTFTFQRGAAFAATGQGGIRLEGASVFTLFQMEAATPGSMIEAQLSYRGKVSPGSRIALAMFWLDAGGKNIGQADEVDIPVGEHSDWRVLAERAEVPEGAEWLYLSLRVQEQMPGDFLELDDFLVSEWKEAEAVQP